MTFSTKTIATLAFAAIAASHGALPVRAGEAAISVGPAKGISMLVGTKRAVGYYLADAGQCKVTVMVSDTYVEQLPPHLATVRFNANVAAGTTAAVDTSDGASLMLKCAVGAKSLMVETIDRVAYEAPRS